MAVNDVYRLSCEWRTTGEDIAINTFTFKQLDGLVFDTPGEDLTQRFDAQVKAAYKAVVGTGFTLAEYHVRGISVPTYGEDFPVSGGVGTVAGQQLPFQCAAIISWRSALIGRRNRGRTFLPPTTEGVSDSGVLTTSYTDAMDDLIEAILGMSAPNVNYAGWQIGVWSTVGLAFQPYTSGVARGILGTQRKRALSN